MTTKNYRTVNHPTVQLNTALLIKMSSGDREESFKIDKLRGNEDFVSRSGDVRQLLRSNYPMLLGLREGPVTNSAAYTLARRKAEAKAKARVPSLRSGAVSTSMGMMLMTRLRRSCGNS